MRYTVLLLLLLPHLSLANRSQVTDLDLSSSEVQDIFRGIRELLFIRLHVLTSQPLYDRGAIPTATLPSHQRLSRRARGVIGIWGRERRAPVSLLLTSLWSQTDTTVAIALTLCSMQSALQVVPSDCLPWATGAEVEEGSKGEGWWAKIRATRGSPEGAQRALCLGSAAAFPNEEKELTSPSALHRSPQDWTSYNAFLSDASEPQGSPQEAMA